MKIILEKLNELPNAHHPNNIEVGFCKEGELMEPPKVGDSFWVGRTWRTSQVVEIIDANTFKTLNSIYKFTEVPNSII